MKYLPEYIPVESENQVSDEKDILNVDLLTQEIALNIEDVIGDARMILESMIDSGAYDLSHLSRKEVIKKITKSLKKMEKKKGSPLDLDFEVPQHIHFWLQHLSRYKNSRVKLSYEKYMDSNDTKPIYPSKERPNSQLLAHPEALLEHMISNLNSLKEAPEIQKIFTQIQEILDRGGNIAFLTNHSDWSTQLLSLYFANQMLNIPKDNNVSFLGAAATTIKKFDINPRKMAGTQGQVLISIPSTERAIPKGLSEEKIDQIKANIKKHNMRFIRTLLGLIDTPNEGKGHVFHIAPSGATDIRDGEMLKLIPPAAETANLIDMFQKKGTHILPIGMNVDLFTSWDGTMRPREAFIHFGELISPETRESTDINILMHKIASLVQNQDGKVVGSYSL